MRPIPTLPERRPTRGQEQEEAETLMRVANAIAAELPAVTSEHWHDALRNVSARLHTAAGRRGYRPSLGEVA